MLLLTVNWRSEKKGPPRDSLYLEFCVSPTSKNKPQMFWSSVLKAGLQAWIYHVSNFENVHERNAESLKLSQGKTKKIQKGGTRTGLDFASIGNFRMLLFIFLEGSGLELLGKWPSNASSALNHFLDHLLRSKKIPHFQLHSIPMRRIEIYVHFSLIFV